MDVLLLCQFAIWTFLYHLWRFTTWMLRYLDSSHLWSFRHQDNSPPPWTFLILCLNVCNLLSGGETSIANHPSVLSKWPKVQNVQTANCLRWQRNVQVADWRSSETSCHQYHSCWNTSCSSWCCCGCGGDSLPALGSELTDQRLWEWTDIREHTLSAHIHTNTC